MTRSFERVSILSEVITTITVYSTEPCSLCTRVKGLLEARNVEFVEVNLSKDPVGRTELAQKTGMMSFPRCSSAIRRGFAEFDAAAENGRLDELVAA
jgi:glutaredoxin 3